MIGPPSKRSPQFSSEIILSTGRKKINKKNVSLASSKKTKWGTKT